MRRIGSIPLVWYLVFMMAPLVLLLASAFARRGTYGGIEWVLTTDSFQRALDPLYASILLKSAALAAATTVLCGVLGFPSALAMATAESRWRGVLLFFITVPFLTNLIVRIAALKAMTAYDGPLTQILTSVGVDFDPFSLSQNMPLVLLGMVSVYLPFFIFPVYAALERFDFSLLEAARDLGASDRQALHRVLLPLMKQPIVVGSGLVFVPALGEYIIPDLLGGAKVMLAGNLIAEQFLKARDWPFGSALSLSMLAILAGTLLWVHRVGAKS